jgi:hypothetical protein
MADIGSCLRCLVTVKVDVEIDEPVRDLISRWQDQRWVSRWVNG